MNKEKNTYSAFFEYFVTLLAIVTLNALSGFGFAVYLLLMENSVINSLFAGFLLCGFGNILGYMLLIGYMRDIYAKKR